VILNDDGDPVCVGLVLRFDNGELAMGAVADEWVLAVAAVRDQRRHQGTVTF